MTGFEKEKNGSQIWLTVPKDLVPNSDNMSVTGPLISNLVHSYFLHKDALRLTHNMTQINNPMLEVRGTLNFHYWTK